MEFVDELPGVEPHINSQEIIDELKRNPGKWGKFYEQGSEDRKTSYSRINGLRIYATRHKLPLTVRTITENDVTTGWARWEG